MSKPLFIAVEPFDPSDGEAWWKYCEWAKIPTLTEVITLDSALCRRIITEFEDEDWSHIVNEDFRKADAFQVLGVAWKAHQPIANRGPGRLGDASPPVRRPERLRSRAVLFLGAIDG